MTDQNISPHNKTESFKIIFIKHRQLRNISNLDQQHSQMNKYNAQAEGLIEAAMISRHKVSHRDVDDSTEISNEEGTTDKAIGDVTAEIMITTPGKIPNEMYYMEDTTVEALVTSHDPNGTDDLSLTPLITSKSPTDNEISGHSAIFLSLLIALGIILFLCCSTACFIAKTKRKGIFMRRSDTECDPNCNGTKQPLLGRGKGSDLTSKASASSGN